MSVFAKKYYKIQKSWVDNIFSPSYYEKCSFIIPDNNFNVVSFLCSDTENFLEPGVAGKRRNEVNHVILFKITRAGEALFMGSCVILVLSTEHYSQCTGDCIIVMYRRLTYVIKLESNEQTLNGTHSRP